ncbi:MAG TPA: tRNA 2-thiouridine(34) synthase MnmA [Candidatus Cybelea sp.]|nr:tRNA 2-thiouridine(34) synthase MnmA [Candidatus Cybelea sp.]
MNSIGLNQAPSETRVVVAMSGGVDSSVTAALLKAEGYDVVGVTLQLYDQGTAAKRKGACCAGQDIHDARRVAETLDIPHYVLDYEQRFRKDVIEDFAGAYAKGETPIPCVRCNQTVKFRDLLTTARDLGAEALATGHYVRRKMGPDGAELHRAREAARDQSYFLFATTREQLDFLRFPLGDLSKGATRELAERFRLPVARKPDSQDICFVPQGRYTDVVRRLRPEAGEPGDIVDLAGRVLGRHEGVMHFTVGQRRGLGGGSAEPLFVVRLDVERHRVIVGPRQALATRRVRLRDANWLADIDAAGPLDVSVQVRSTQRPVAARVATDADSVSWVEFAAPEFGVSPGQACVVYDDTRVLGGGWIAAAESARSIDTGDHAAA